MAGADSKGIALASIAAGAVLVWSGVTGKSVLQGIQATIKGQAPSTASQQFPIAQIAQTTSPSSSGSGGSSAPAAPANISGNVALGKLLAAPYGWATGAEWNALYDLWQRESGWSNTVANQGSGALGIAQALGHGTATSAGSLGNEYPSQAANNGSASAQITWGLGYIKSTYGDPEAAWAHEESAGWY